MSLKNLIKGRVASTALLIPEIDELLFSKGDDEDRGHGLNSPSSASACPLSQFYLRNKELKDGNNDPRSQRIFDNGNDVHDRLQGYLLATGRLLMAEVPVWDWELEILGHTDGILKLTDIEVAILEIKSINSNGFGKLMDAKDEHKEQAQVYMMTLERLREILHNKCKSTFQFKKYRKEFLAKYRALLETFVEEGRKFTKAQKIEHQCKCMSDALSILWRTTKPIRKMIFLYENKDTQELKEYHVGWDEELVSDLQGRYKKINKTVSTGKQPKRPEEATGKSCQFCRWCRYKLKCWH